MAETIATTQQPEPSPRIWGETYGFWCQSLVLFAAVVVAVVAIISSRITERRKASAAVLFSSRKDSELLDSLRRVTALHEGDQSIGAFAKREKNETVEAKSIRYALNHFEYVSVGISQGIYDEKIFKQSNYTTVIKLYERTKPFIDETRRVRGTETLLQEFECLACRWISTPLKHKPLKYKA
jgi:Domain of unknown function (DUF4760)